jgi:hypothetical protein
VPDAAAERVAARARERVERALERGGPEPRRGERPARRRRYPRRLAMVVGGVAIAAAAAFACEAMLDGQGSAKAAGRPLSSFDAFTRSVLEHKGLLGTAPLTQAGRADPLGRRLFVGRGGSGTCVIVVAGARPHLLGARCGGRAPGSAGRPGDVFHLRQRSGPPSVEGLAGPQVRRVAITDATGHTTMLTPRHGVFGAWVDGTVTVALIGAHGQVLTPAPSRPTGARPPTTERSAT